MTGDLNRTAVWSAIPSAGRTSLRTRSNGRPPPPAQAFPHPVALLVAADYPPSTYSFG